MAFLHSLNLSVKRARARWVLSLLSVGGIALTVGLVASIPVFTESVGMAILHRELAEAAHGIATPLLAIRYYRIPSAPGTMTVQEALDVGDWLGLLTRREVGITVARKYVQIGSHAFTMRPLPGDTRYKTRVLRQVRINCIPGIEEHIEITEGASLSQAGNAEELLVWARPKLLEEVGAQVGERFELYNHNAIHPDRPSVFRIAGLWQAEDPSSSFWYRDPHDLLESEFLTPLESFARFVAPIMPQQIDYSFWYYVLDERRLRLDDVDGYARGAELAQFKAESALPSTRVDRTPIEPLTRTQTRVAVLERLLLGFSLPAIVLLMVFVGAISATSLHYEQGEIAILMSRGAGRTQVFTMNALEGLVHVALGTPIGLLASLGFARAVTLSTGLLTFKRGALLPLHTQGLRWEPIALVSAFSLIARLVPTLGASRRTVVTYGRERARTRGRDWPARLLFMAVLCSTTAYAPHLVRARGTFGLASWELESEAKGDPLLFLAPSLFMVTAAVLASQLFPVVMRVPDLVSRVLGTPLYLGIRSLSRQSEAYGVAIFLLVLCICLGAFEASIARSADLWLVDRLRHKVGADYRFTLGTEEIEGGIILGQDSWLLPVAEYRKLPGVTDATRVGDHVALPAIKSLEALRLLGVDRLDFARVAYFREDYADRPLGELLNRLATDRDGILLERRYLEAARLSLGDRLALDVYVDGVAARVPFKIIGTFDHFPTMYPSERRVAVADLDFIHSQLGGIQPHSIWLRTVPDGDVARLRAALKQLGVVELNELDSRAMIAEDLKRLERVGIYGSLSVGFLASSLVAWAGLAVSTVASLRGRVRRFAVLRALGLSGFQVLAATSVEYLGVIAYSVAIGAIAGVATSRLFVSYFLLTEDPNLQVPPLVARIAWAPLLWIVIAYLAALTVTEVIVLWRTMRRKAFEALRVADEE